MLTNRHTCRLWWERVIAAGPDGFWEVAEGRGNQCLLRADTEYRAEVGILKIGTVALNGTKLYVNASRDSALSHEREQAKYEAKQPHGLRYGRHDPLSGC